MPAKTYIVEHLDPELPPWSETEYLAVANESAAAGSAFCLSSLSKDLTVPPRLALAAAASSSKPDSSLLRLEARSVEEMYPENGHGEYRKDRVCLLDPKAEKDLSPADGEEFGTFLFGGILGDDPPQDRTRILREKGFSRRRLGSKQMTTDTAVRVTRMVIQDKIDLDKIQFEFAPNFKVNQYESTSMPFNYVVKDGKPVVGEGMLEHYKKAFLEE